MDTFPDQKDFTHLRTLSDADLEANLQALYVTESSAQLPSREATDEEVAVLAEVCYRVVSRGTEKALKQLGIRGFEKC